MVLDKVKKKKKIKSLTSKILVKIEIIAHNKGKNI